MAFGSPHIVFRAADAICDIKLLATARALLSFEEFAEVGHIKGGINNHITFAVQEELP